MAAEVEVKYVGLNTKDPLIVLMPDETLTVVSEGGTLKTTPAHAKQMCESESWEIVKGKGSD